MSVFRQTETGKRREELTALFQERGEMDSDRIIALLCNEFSLEALEQLADQYGMLPEEPAVEYEDDDDADAEEDDEEAG